MTFFIYIRAGREIYRKHKQLKDLNYTSHYESEPLPMDGISSSKTTEVSVTVTDAQGAGIDLSPLGASATKHQSISAQSQRSAAYSVSISARPSNKAGHSPTAATTTHPASSSQPNKPKSGHRATLDAHNAAWSYTKCALLFFTAMLVTWIPSSTNRLYSLARNGQISLPLEYMSAFVLPLQGFWNAVIYITTSWKACKMLGEDMAAFFKRSGGASSSSSPSPSGVSASGFAGVLRSRSRMGGVLGREDGIGASGRMKSFVRRSKGSETESMEELAVSGQSGMATP